MEHKIALVYTGMPFSLVKRVEAELTKAFEGDKLTFITLSDPSIIADAVKNGRPSVEALKRLNAMYAQAVNAGAEAILNICSSVGDFAGVCQPVCEALGVPLVRIDEEMALQATASYERIGVIATLSSTLEPSLRLLEDCAMKQGRQVRLEGVLADNAFGGGAEKLIEAAKKLDKPDCLVLAQGSMADNAGEVAAATGLKVFESPSNGAKAVYKAVKGK
ncbi:MAG: aspartate/glutamate racemase family protein [Clostridiales bacterium]|nr:aspartate/glutamate racemase family protein [Clostridiales bacterium]